MDKNRKKGIIIFAVAVVVIIIAIVAWNSSQKVEESKFVEQGHSWQNDFIAALDEGDYICDDIAKDIKDTDVESWKEKDGSTGFIAAKNDTDGTDIHNIQYEVKDNDLIFYHYKNYSFDAENGKKIDNSKAGEIAKEFADEFIAGGNKLTFKNKEDEQIKSLYNPNKVETWHAKDGKGEYYIVIDLEKGNVLYYCSSEYKDMENL